MENLLYINNDIEKSVVHQHQRKTKSGKLSNVKQYEDSRSKKEKESKKNLDDELVTIEKKNDQDKGYKILKEKKLYSLEEKEKRNKKVNLNNFQKVMAEAAEKQGGVWENFGQHELRKLKDKYKYNPYSHDKNMKRIVNKIDDLNEWSKNFDLSQLNKSTKDDLQFYINIEKAHVKAHQSKSKTGKVIQVKDYSNKVMKRQQLANNKQNAQPQEQQDENNQQQQQDQQIQNNSGTAELEKEKRHLDFMLSKYPDMVDKNKVMQRMKDIDKAINKVNAVIQDAKLSKHKSDKKEDNKSENEKNNKIKLNGQEILNQVNKYRSEFDRYSKDSRDYHELYSEAKNNKQKDVFLKLFNVTHNIANLFGEIGIVLKNLLEKPKDEKNNIVNAKKEIKLIESQIDSLKKEQEKLMNNKKKKVVSKIQDTKFGSEPTYKDLKDMKKGDTFKHKGNDVKFKKAGANYVLGLMRVDKDTVRNIKIYDGGKVKVGRLRNNDNSYKTDNSKPKQKK